MFEGLLVKFGFPVERALSPNEATLSSMSIREQQEKERLSSLDGAYTGRSVCEVGFYSVLSDVGIEPTRSLLLDIVPDSGSTVIGRVIDEYGALWNFDIDFIETPNSEVERVTADPNRMLNLDERITQEIARSLLAEKLR